MNQQFPHVLAAPKPAIGVQIANIARVVSPSINIGDDLMLLIKTKEGNVIKHPFKVEEIINQRKARGDWNGWGVHPNYYELKLSKS